MTKPVGRQQGPEARRLTNKSIFRFHCHSGLACFTRCCRDVNILLSPYDALRMKKRLGTTSEAFLEGYTHTLFSKQTGFPVVVLKMREDPDKSCPFVGPDGCTIYEERPWACRMYPLDGGDGKGMYRFLADPRRCLGMGEKRRWTVGEYLFDQGLICYDEWEAPLSRIASTPRFSKEKLENPKIQEMCRMALYDLDRFRRFVLENRFLHLFQVERELVERIKSDEDLALLRLAYHWLEFGLVGGETLKIREDVVRGRAFRGAEAGERPHLVEGSDS